MILLLKNSRVSLLIKILILKSLFFMTFYYVYFAASGIVFGIIGRTLVSRIVAIFRALLAFYLAKWLVKRFVQKKSKKTHWLQKVEELWKNGFMIVLIVGF